MTDKKFQRFGKYLILDHLVDGGMAKICRARYLGEQANKVVAIKMVQPQFSNDDAYVRMFQDELNITFGMLHPNIMQVYDYGKTNGQLYTAMEYIHGANLKQYMDRLREKKKAFPVESTCYIISQVCLGLYYAHTFTDKLTGKPYNIIHRDISPHNIMLTYDGAVKVIDFGIAKAITNSEATQAGTIKGKLSYLAPEYLEGLELDARYDQFAVGITLWELLCSRKLFQANNDLAVLKMIQQCKITPPSEINPTVPKELDAIVMKALSKDRSQRYENLDQMNRALVKFLYATYSEFNPSDLRSFADDLFSNEIGRDKDKFVEYGRIDVQTYIEDMKKEEKSVQVKKEVIEGKPPVTPEVPPPARLPPALPRGREIELNIDNGPNIEIEKGIDHHKTTTQRLNKTVAQQTRVVAKTKVDRTGLTTRPSGMTKRPDHNKTTSRQIDGLNDSEDGNSSKVKIAVVASCLLVFSYLQGDLVENWTGINLKKMIHPSANRSISSVKKDKNSRTETSTSESEERGRVILGGLDISMLVFIDGQKTDWTKPISIPLDKEVIVTVKKAGYVNYSTKVILENGKTSTVVTIPKLERSRLGILSSSKNYSVGSKLVYTEGGEVVERDLPFSEILIPEGTYQAKVINPLLKTEKKVEFIIEENKKHFLE